MSAASVSTPVPMPASTSAPTHAYDADRQVRLSRLASVHAALHRLDPDAQVALDPDVGRMKVLTVLPPEQVLEILRALGEPAEAGEPAPDTARAGNCGCGCRSG